MTRAAIISVWVGLVFAACFSASVLACGFPSCQAKADQNNANPSPPGIFYFCEDQPEFETVYLMYTYSGVTAYSGTNYDYCPCDTATPPSGGTMFMGMADIVCVGGCEFEAGGEELGVCFGEGCTLNMAAETYQPTGAQCANESDTVDPDDLCDLGDPGDCVKADPGDPPMLCTTNSRGEWVCTGPNSCSGDPEVGFTCAGAPPPDPPPPPETKPDPPPAPWDQPGQPDYVGNCRICVGGHCSDCVIEHYKGPGEECPEGQHEGAGDTCVDDTTNCPPGQHNDGGLCVDDDERCPDGSFPVNDQCVAPWANCPDGSTPTDEGECLPTHSDCPGGEPPVNGWCQAQEGHCADGSEPIPGEGGVLYCPTPGMCPDGSIVPPGTMCHAPWGTCPSGAQPVGGVCPVGEGCDPETDPEQCTGNDEGHASGGQSCDAPPACSGDVIACAQLVMQWRTRCAVEEGNDGEGDGEGEEPDAPPTEADYGDTHTGAEAWSEPGDEGGILEQIDAGGWLGGGDCPTLPSASIAGVSVDLSGAVPCDAWRILATLILLGGWVQAAYIVGRSV